MKILRVALLATAAACAQTPDHERMHAEHQKAMAESEEARAEHDKVHAEHMKEMQRR